MAVGRANPGARRLARRCGTRILRISRRPDQRLGPGSLPHPSYPALAPRATAPESARPDYLGADGAAGVALASPAPHRASVAGDAILAPSPNVGALCDGFGRRGGGGGG